MSNKYNEYTFDDDLEIVRSIMSNEKTEEIAERIGRENAECIYSRTYTLGLKKSAIKKMAKAGMSAKAILQTTELYRPVQEEVVEVNMEERVEQFMTEVLSRVRNIESAMNTIIEMNKSYPISVESPKNVKLVESS